MRERERHERTRSRKVETGIREEKSGRYRDRERSLYDSNLCRTCARKTAMSGTTIWARWRKNTLPVTAPTIILARSQYFAPFFSIYFIAIPEHIFLIQLKISSKNMINYWPSSAGNHALKNVNMNDSFNRIINNLI